MIKGEIKWQYALIALGVVVTALFGVFFVRELFPEYKKYQEAFVALEEFRSTYTHEKPAPFKYGIKQIVLERSDKGPAVIDRCTSCHVALQIEAYSKLRVKKDEKGKVLLDGNGVPVKEENPNYIFKHLTEEIAKLSKEGATKSDLKLAEHYKELMSLEVGEFKYSMDKVLVAHPLIGKETRPFEFHPIEDYGCVSCHGGNGRGLVTDRAHGPVFDGEYEVEHRGYVPKFLESDPNNDPKFSKIFNEKPGPRLLFQVSPIYVGALIEAKCVQCHNPSKDYGKNEGEVKDILSNVDPLIRNYMEGRDLFISQGCYACHRVSRFSRGGVGPELSRSGDGYPWYVKESIVWPQADLKTSTMPNLKLDHDELEKLTTYLLGQTSSNKTLSEPALKAETLAWENGKKQSFEKPVNEKQAHNLEYGMTIFAVEGCASCHRLKGFESDAGFKIEKESPTFVQVENERNWFEKLFPDNVTGSQIVKAIESNKEEINQRIISDLRKDSIVTKIEKNHPGTIEALYSNFKFAFRAKDHEGEAISKPWRALVSKVFYQFINEYGLGRLICPSPSWSGVYRTDAWLFEHFKAPGSHVPKSIMPAFPFDDTKYLALIYMLDTLAEKNVNNQNVVWKEQGFNPEVAYKLYCSQCHGVNLQGNGPIAEWLYPIPKNLRKEGFLKNLTKEKAIESIVKGVPGTPMPPWGSLGDDKDFPNKTPVMTESEIKQLVDWIFSEVSETNTSEGYIPPKWNYKKEDVEKDLNNEGNSLLKDNSDPIFEKEGDKGYFIKKEFYTQENLEAGRRFFVENCAACHGKEGDGAGPRAEAMYEAKPRMLTNYDWIHSKDDIRLIQSIKYGVPGTSMTPWGDLTSSLQRLQLVMYIRSLSGDKTRATLHDQKDWKKKILEEKKENKEKEAK